MKKLLVAVVIAGVLSGCSSTPNEELLSRLEAMEEAKTEMMEKRTEAEQDQREAEIDAAPSWLLEPPQPDGTGMFGVGYSKSKNLGHGIKAARLQAEFALASLYKQELSGSERAYEQGSDDGEVNTQTTFLIDKLVDAVPVVGYEVVEQVVEPIGGVNHIYVLLKLPYDQFNKVLQAQKDAETNKNVQAAFDDLERRLDKRRAQKAEDSQSSFEREQEALKNRADILNGSAKAQEPSNTSTNVSAVTLPFPLNKGANIL